MRSDHHSTITIHAALLQAEQLLAPLHESARIDAEVLLSYGISQTRTYLHTWPEHPLTSEQVEHYSSLIRRRAAGEPVAYLTGRREFWSLPLTVTNATLVPRPETELLVEHALSRIPSDAIMRVADLGTGCGAIALAIASERPASRVIATDIDIQALHVARINAAQLDIDNVEFRQGEWLEPLQGECFHIIMSNPPYIGEHDPNIGQGDLRFEPSAALTAGQDGLDAIRIIVAQAKQHLLHQGWLLVEHGHEQQAEVLELLRQARYHHIQGVADLTGHDRVVIGQYLQA